MYHMKKGLSMANGCFSKFIMKMVDDKKIAFTPAVELAHVKPQNQSYISLAIVLFFTKNGVNAVKEYRNK